ncbi:hypothetical protein ACHAPG_001971 [Botrytis cinerea]
MASDKTAVASGADHTQTTRRRNVPSSNGSLVNTVEVDDKKTQVKKGKLSLVGFLDEWEFLIAPLVFTIFAFFTRLYKIGLSPIVTWDEAQ